MNNGDIPAQTVDETAFGILQAAFYDALRGIAIAVADAVGE